MLHLNICLSFIFVYSSNELHWRDVQELLIRTSKPTGLLYGNFLTNAVGRPGNLYNHAVRSRLFEWLQFKYTNAHQQY